MPTKKRKTTKRSLLRRKQRFSPRRLALAIGIIAVASGGIFCLITGTNPLKIAAATPPSYVYFSYNNGGVAIDQFMQSGYVSTPTNLKPTYLQVNMDGGTYRAIYAMKGQAKPTRAVVLLHGVGMKAQDFIPYSQWDNFVASQKNLAIFSVEGLGAYNGNANLAFNSGETVVNGQVKAFCCYYAVWNNINDGGFLVSLASHLRSLGFSEVDVVGFSNGGMMAMQMACRRPGVFDHTGAFAGTIESPDCPAKNKLHNVIAINGSQDTAVTQSGPPFQYFGVGILNSVAVMKAEAGTGGITYVTNSAGHVYPTKANSNYNGTCQIWNYFGHATVCN